MKDSNYNSNEGTRMVLDAIAGLYNSVHIVNLEEDTYFEVSASAVVHSCLGENGCYSEGYRHLMEEICRPEQLEGVLEFGEPKMVTQNLTDTNVAVYHFADLIHGWTEANQIVLSRDEEGRPTEFLFTTKIEDRRMREEMKYREIVYALSKVYSITVKFYIESDECETIGLPEDLRDVIPMGRSKSEAFLSAMIENCIEESSREKIGRFMDFSTLQDRMKGKSAIFTEFHGIRISWGRALIVPSRLDEEGKVIEAVMAVENISEEKRREEAYAYRADHDNLTGLLNRNAYERCELQYEKAPCPIAYLIMDIDNFKTINDTYGHETGDRVLKTVADVLRQTFRTSDMLVRMGGDEFVVIAPNFSENLRAKLVERMESINRALRETEENIPRISVSIGAAFSKKGFPKDLFKKADIALYHMKNTGRAGWVIYDDSMANEQENIITKVDVAE